MSASEDREIAAASSGRRRTVGTDKLWELDLLGRVWRSFTSVRLALILILIITAAVLAGTLLMQAPGSATADAESYNQWLEGARSKYGPWTALLDTLQLFNVFHSLWFRLLVGLLTVNIVVCTVNRWKGIWSSAFRTRTRMGDAFFEHARFNAHVETDVPVAAAAEQVKRALSRSRYRVKVEAGDDAIAIYADRNRLSRFGTFLSHLSIVLILAGAIVGGIWGATDPEFIVAEGTTRELGLDSSISVRLEHFVDEYYLEGPPKDFRSQLVIYDNGVEVKRGMARVNSPLNYKGYKFLQSFFGQAAEITVVAEDGRVLFDDTLPLAWSTTDVGRPIGSFGIPEDNLRVYVVGPQSGYDDPLIPAGEMRIEIYSLDTETPVVSDNVTQGTPKELAGLKFTFERERRFTGLKVVKDPGVNIIWVASTLMIVGLVMLFYFPHRRLWALCRSRPDGTVDVRLATPAQRDLSLEGEFRRLSKRVRSALGADRHAGRSDEGGNAHV